MFLGQAGYTGLAYHVDEAGVVGRLEAFRDGFSEGASEDWLDLPEGGLRVDSGFLDMTEEGGPLLFQDQPFTGISYYFDEGDGHCVEEERVESGEIESGRGFFPNGKRRYETNGMDCLHWLEDGRIGAKDYQGLTVYRLTLDEAGQLFWLVLRDASLLELEVVNSLRLAADFKLSGQGVDSHVLHALSRHPDFPAIRQLRLASTDVAGGDLVDILRQDPSDPLGRTGLNLTGIELVGNPGVLADDAAQLTAMRPSCAVTFDPGSPRKGADWFRQARAYVDRFDHPIADPADEAPHQAIVAKQAFERALKAYCVRHTGGLPNDAEAVVQHLLYQVPSPLAVLDRDAVPTARRRVQSRDPDRWAEGWEAVHRVHRAAQQMVEGMAHLEVLQRIDAARPELGAPNPPMAAWNSIRAALGELFEAIQADQLEAE
jgi:hypothetical protein